MLGDRLWNNPQRFSQFVTPTIPSRWKLEGKCIIRCPGPLTQALEILFHEYILFYSHVLYMKFGNTIAYNKVVFFSGRIGSLRCLLCSLLQSQEVSTYDAWSSH